jgi:hypothetical protein
MRASAIYGARWPHRAAALYLWKADLIEAIASPRPST